ncbi:SNF2-related protein [Streptosporangium sp. CA-115845]|uniref:SNF2-related protein n=1 Tax=Streptosporangium sp. CA-115845 TaxID=3240071 RepID=UPI003D8E1545
MTTRPTPLTTSDFLKKRAQDKERQELRGGDAAAFRRLEDREFSRLLSRACADGLWPGAFAAEVTRRAGAGRLRTRDLRALLLDGTAAHAQMQPARSAAWTALALAPEHATAVLTSHAQAVKTVFVLRKLPARDGLGRFGAQAGWRTPDGFAHGIAAYADQRKTAQHRAAVSLLGHLCAVQPVVQESGDGAEWEPVAVGDNASVALAGALSADGFRAQLQQVCVQAAVAPALVAEIAARARAGVLDPRDVYLVLFQAPAPQWEPARRAIMDSIAVGEGFAPAILNLHAAAAGQPTPVYEDTVIPGATQETTRFQTRVTYDPGTGPLHADSAPERSKRHARRSAAVAVLAQLAGLALPEPSQVPEQGTSVGPLPPDKNPISALNELAQIELITDVAFEVSPGFSGKQPLFTCQATCRSKGRDLEAAGSGLSKGAAREQAARALLALIVADDEPRPAAPVQAVPAIKPLAPGKDPLGALNSLRQTGVITDVEPDYSTTGPAHRRVFQCTLSCRYQDQTVQAQGRAPSKRASYQVAARALLARLALVPASPVAHADNAEDAAPEPATPAFVPHPRTAPAAGTPAQTLLAVRLLESVLRAGAAVSADLSGSAARMVIYHPDGSSLPDTDPPAPLRAENVELVLPGMGVGVRAASVPVWPVPLRLLAGVLARLADDGLHPSTQTWRAVIRLGLEAIADERVYPGTDSAGRDAWHLGPLTSGQQAIAADLAEAMPPYAHCVPAARTPYQLWAPRIVVRRVLDALADAVVRGPGTAYALGAAPYTAPSPRPQSLDLVAWTDQIDTILDPRPPLGLVVTIKPPPANSPGDTELLWAVLRIKTTSPGGESRLVDAATYLPEHGADPLQLERVRRSLRAAARLWPPLQRLLEQDHPARFTVHAAEAALLLGEMGQNLARYGIEITWPEQWARALGVRALIGTRHAPEAGEPAFGLDNVLDFRWQLTVDGDGLTDAEMDTLATAGRALVHLRGRWLLVTAQTARRAAGRDLGMLPAAEALTAALTGSLTVDGDLVACEPTDALADLVEFLRVGSYQPIPAPAALKATLRDYQARGLAWLANLTRFGFGACLADDMGIGKTITAIALHLHRREQAERAAPTLVICPASMLATWEREITRFAPATPTRRYHGEGRTLEGLSGDEVVITTYGTLRRDADILAAQSFDLAIADEAQQVKNHRSLTARQLRRLSAKARVALTGTPVENGLMDAWSVLDWTNPGLFGSPRTFNDRYARPIEHDPDGDEARRLTRVLAPFMLRRRKSDPHILKELPAKVTTRRYVTLTLEQVSLYEAVARQAMEQIRAAQPGERRALVLTLITHLRQICNTPAHYLREIPDPHRYDPQVERRRSGKLTALDERLSPITAGGESALVFTNYAAMGQLLVTHLRAQGIDPLFLHGQIPPGKARQDLVDAFQARRNPVMILTVKAGGTGLTLTEAGHVVMFDRPWNPAVEDQAIDRAHRIGQARILEVHLMQTELTIEDRIDTFLEGKRALADAVLASGETALADLSDTELAELIALGARS